MTGDKYNFDAEILNRNIKNLSIFKIKGCLHTYCLRTYSIYKEEMMYFWMKISVSLVKSIHK